MTGFIKSQSKLLWSYGVAAKPKCQALTLPNFLPHPNGLSWLGRHWAALARREVPAAHAAWAAERNRQHRSRSERVEACSREVRRTITHMMREPSGASELESTPVREGYDKNCLRTICRGAK